MTILTEAAMCFQGLVMELSNCLQRDRERYKEILGVLKIFYILVVVVVT